MKQASVSSTDRGGGKRRTTRTGMQRCGGGKGEEKPTTAPPGSKPGRAETVTPNANVPTPRDKATAGKTMGETRRRNATLFGEYGK